MTDANALAQRRPGRPPKANKRVPLSLLVDPKLRVFLAHAAEENGRSITRQTELLPGVGHQNYPVRAYVRPPRRGVSIRQWD